MQLFTDQTIQALYWTLVHSMWQGLLLAIMGGLVIVSTKKSGPGLRYNLLTILFFLFVGATCFTFSRELRLAASSEIPLATSFFPQNEPSTGISSGSNAKLNVVAPENNFVQRIVKYFNANASLVVAIWFIVLCAHCIRLLANIGYIQRIRYHRTHSPPEFWELKIDELAARLHIRKQVELLESEIVKIPMVIGLLKPVILFPFSLLSQLPPQQVEAVLLHELAHIKRKDYFVNLVQSFAEILFFFNPGVLWISTLIREERENCCDDIALNATNCKKELIHALVSFQEYNLSSSKYVTAFPGRSNHLLNRIKRILTNNNKTLNNMEKISLLTGIVIASFIMIAFAQKKQIPGKADSIQSNTSRTDTIPSKEKTKKPESSSTRIAFVDGNKYEIGFANGQVVKLFVNDQRIPDEELGSYKAVIDKVIDKSQTGRTTMKIREEKLQKEQELWRQKQEELRRQFAELDREKLEGQRSGESAQMDQEKLKTEQALMNLKFDRMKMDQENRERIEADMADRAHMQELKSQMELLRTDQEKKEGKEATMADKAHMQELRAEMKLLKRDQENKERIVASMAERAQMQELKSQQYQMNMNLQLLSKIKEKMAGQQSSMSREDFMKQAEMLRLKENELRMQQDQLNLQMEISNKLRALSGDPNIPPSFNSALDPLPPGSQVPILAEVPVPAAPLIQSKPIGSIIDDLVDEKIIKRNEDISFILNNEVLQVNGLPQSGELHKKLKERYLKGANDHVIYSISKGSTHADVFLNPN